MEMFLRIIITALTYALSFLSFLYNPFKIFAAGSFSVHTPFKGDFIIVENIYIQTFELSKGSKKNAAGI